MIIRGLRAVSDFEYEFQMVAMNQQMNDEIETVFLMADPHHQAVSSRLVKEIARLGGKADLFVPEAVQREAARQVWDEKGQVGMFRKMLMAAAALTVAGSAYAGPADDPANWRKVDPENLLQFTINKQEVLIELRPDIAPKPCRAGQEDHARHQLRQAALPSRHRRLHGAGRRGLCDLPDLSALSDAEGRVHLAAAILPSRKCSGSARRRRATSSATWTASSCRASRTRRR